MTSIAPGPPVRGFDLLRISAVRKLVSWAGFPYVFQAAGLFAFVALMVAGWGRYTPEGVGAKLYAKTNLVTLLVWGLVVARDVVDVRLDLPLVGGVVATLGYGYERFRAPSSVVLVRLIVGAVFLSEGIQKFLFPPELGVGRFTKIGLPAPELLAPFVGAFEIACGLLVLLGLLTRLAAVPLIVIMLTAISTTKLPMLMSRGFWVMAHEARTDWSMLLGSIYLLIVGAGAWSFDAVLTAQERR